MLNFRWVTKEHTKETNPSVRVALDGETPKLLRWMVINLMVQSKKKHTQKKQIQAYVSRLFKQFFQVSHDRKKKRPHFLSNPACLFESNSLEASDKYTSV